MKLLFLAVGLIFFAEGAGLSQKKQIDFTEVYKDAEFFYLSNDYLEALSGYKLLLKRGNPNNGQINYLAGICCLNIPSQKSMAISYFEKAAKCVSKKYTGTSLSDTTAPPDVLFYLGNAYRINNQFDVAIEYYQKYMAFDEALIEANRDYCNLEIEHCKFAQNAVKTPVNVSVTALDKPFNTPKRSYSPAVSENESVIVFNSSTKLYEAVLFARKVKDKWTIPTNIITAIQSDGNQFVSSVSASGKTLLLRYESGGDADIYVSHFEKGKWQKSETAGRKINTRNQERNASITSDGKTLYFSSNRKGGSGVLDIYKAELKADGEWGDPVNLGNLINTQYNEDAPLISANGRRLYFVSQGHAGLGGYDRFYSDLKDDGTWSNVVNMGYPINTSDDDMGFCPVNEAIIYTSIISNETGEEKLYHIELKSTNQTLLKNAF